jgi:hypothetical protein
MGKIKPTTKRYGEGYLIGGSSIKLKKPLGI